MILVKEEDIVHPFQKVKIPEIQQIQEMIQTIAIEKELQIQEIEVEVASRKPQITKGNQELSDKVNQQFILILYYSLFF
jgi:hypothetical protein